MKNLLLLSVFLYAVALQGQSITDEYAIRVFARDFMAAYNRQDVLALRAMYTTNNAEDTIGGIYSNYIAQSFEDVFTRRDVTLLVHHIGVTWSDAEHALVATGTYEAFGNTFVYDIPIHTKTAYRNIMVREDDKWKIARSKVTSIIKTFVYQKSGDLAESKWTLKEALNGSGVLSIETGTRPDNPSAGYALLEWPSMEKAKAFFESPEWQNILGKAGKDKTVEVVYLGGE